MKILYDLYKPAYLHGYAPRHQKTVGAQCHGPTVCEEAPISFMDHFILTSGVIFSQMSLKMKK